MREFRIDVPDHEIDELRRRLDAVRLPDAELETPWSEGVPLAWLRDLAAAWRAQDWRAREQRFNAHRQVLVPVDGVEIHAVVLSSGRADAPAVVLTHGWPGTFAEYLEVGVRLASGPDAMDVVVPSLPGYGFSGHPAETGWGVERVADAWVELMAALGHERFVAVGSDWGTSVSAEIGLRHPGRVRALTLIPPLARPDPATLDDRTTAEAAALVRLRERDVDGSAYSTAHETRPQTIAYALTDSPVGLLAWIGEKYAAWAGAGGLAREDVLDAASIYWFTRTAGSSARLYRESIDDVSGLFTDSAAPAIDVPVGGVMFPDEVPWISERWARQRFPDIRVWHEPAAGGHFGALEAPDAVVAAVRATVAATG